MTALYCPNCKERGFTWFLGEDDEGVERTYWFCSLCHYTTEEDETKESYCPNCDCKLSLSFFKDEEKEYWYCVKCKYSTEHFDKTMIYHIISESEWAAVGDSAYYRGDTLDSEGFIHCSTLEQVLETANYLFKGREYLVLLQINPDKLKSPLKYEDGGDGRLFPHIYGPMEVNAVVAVADFPPNLDGCFDLPAEYSE